MSTQTIVTIGAVYLAAGCFGAGRAFEKDADPGRFIDYVYTGIIALIYPVFSMWYFMRKGLKWLWVTFQVSFFWHFLFTTKFDRMDKATLKFQNDVTRQYRNTGSLPHRIFRYTLNLVNKRNGYVPEPAERVCAGANEMIR